MACSNNWWETGLLLTCEGALVFKREEESKTMDNSNNAGWELAKNIARMPCDSRNKIFNHASTTKIIKEYTYDEAAKKYKEFNRIMPGDYVKFEDGDIGLCLEGPDENYTYLVMYCNETGHITATYFHYNMLTKIGEEENLMTWWTYASSKLRHLRKIYKEDNDENN